jgi:hypothetical protein
MQPEQPHTDASSQLTAPSQPRINYAYKARRPDSKVETTVLYLGTRHGVPQIQTSFNGQFKFHEARLDHDEKNEPVFIIGKEVE